MKTPLIDELRAASPATLEGNTLTGIAIPYNRVVELGRGMFEVMRPGCVADLLRSSPKISAIYEHAPTSFLGSTADGTLKLIDGDDALRYEITLPDTSYANDLRSAMKANPNAFGASWNMNVQPEGYDLLIDGGNATRSITRINKLREITITAFPVYVDTTAMLRSVQQLRDERPNVAALGVAYCETLKLL
jgi:HK97 family phage prohead protease